MTQERANDEQAFQLEYLPGLLGEVSIAYWGCIGDRGAYAVPSRGLVFLYDILLEAGVPHIGLVRCQGYWSAGEPPMADDVGTEVALLANGQLWSRHGKTTREAMERHALAGTSEAFCVDGETQFKPVFVWTEGLDARDSVDGNLGRVGERIRGCVAGELSRLAAWKLERQTIGASPIGHGRRL